jgi:seryl-tRNA synthetase
MHDPRTLLDPTREAVRRLARRGYHLDLGQAERLVAQRTASAQEYDSLRAAVRTTAEKVRTSHDAERQHLVSRAHTLKSQLRTAQEEARRCEHALREFLLAIPNLPDDDAPDGDSQKFAEEIRRVGRPPTFDFTPLDHATLGERTGILDPGRAVKLSGARFAVLSGAGAALERALTQFLLSMHVTRHGYTEYSVPALVNRATMTGTGQLPKFEEDLFRTNVSDRELFLIPTGEVPLTNLYAGETIAINRLPLALTAHTPCFRSEAGSYGSDTRGLIRLHEFAKVELVRLCEVTRAGDELETMVRHAEACLQDLGLAYRVVALAAGDLGFAAEYTFDLEAWLPGRQDYCEISSCSRMGTFQARRANIRTKSAGGRSEYVATLNGSALPIGRTMAAVLEQNQQPDGSIEIPEVLIPLTGFSRIRPDGSTVR